MDACLRCQAESKVDARSSGSAAKVIYPTLYFILRWNRRYRGLRYSLKLPRGFWTKWNTVLWRKNSQEITIIEESILFSDLFKQFII